MRRRTAVALSAATIGAAAIGVVVTALPASAATGCRVAYSVSSQWPGGFGANVTVTNLGDPVSAWTLVWSYAAGQQVTQAWNATVTQSGSQVTAKNAGYNGSLATNASTSFGFNGSWTGSNPVPASFALNGTACTGGVSGTPSPTPTPARRASPTSPSHAAPPTSGVPADAAWVATGAWDTWTNNGYTVINDVWGSGAGPQTIWARTGTNWGVVAEHPRTSGVKSYPHTGKTLNRTLSSLGSVRSSFNVTVPGRRRLRDRVRHLGQQQRLRGHDLDEPARRGRPDRGVLRRQRRGPDARNVSVGGHTWNVYRGLERRQRRLLLRADQHHQLRHRGRPAPS